MIFMTIYGFIHGNVNKLMAPMDGAGNFCGVTDGYKDYPNLYISNLMPTGTVNPVNSIFKSGVCVKHCPKKGSNGEITISCARNALFAAGGTCGNIKDASVSAEYTIPYTTTNLFGFCLTSPDKLPPKAKAGYKMLAAELRQSKGGQAIGDIVKALSSIYITVATAFIFSLVLLYLMSAYAETIAWICIVLTALGAFGGAVACWFMRASVIAQRGTAGTDTALYGDN